MRPGMVAELVSTLDEITQLVPGHVSGLPHARTDDVEDAAHAVFLQCRRSNLIMIDRSVVNRYDDSALLPLGKRRGELFDTK